MIECLKNYGQRFLTLYSRQGQDHPRKKKCKKAQWVSEDALQIAEKRREVKNTGEKLYPFECRVPKKSKER